MRQGHGALLSQDIVGEADPSPREVSDGGADLKEVVVAGGAEVANLGFDHGQAEPLLFQLPVAEAQVAQQVGAGHLEPGQVLPVPGHSHLVGLRITNAKGGVGTHAHRQASISRRQPASGSPLPNTAEPATRMSAPASPNTPALLSST